MLGRELIKEQPRRPQDVVSTADHGIRLSLNDRKCVPLIPMSQDVPTRDIARCHGCRQPAA